MDFSYSAITREHLTVETTQTFNSAPSIVQDQSTRQGLVGIYENHAKKNGSAPSIQQLFNAARAACAVDHDKDVVSGQSRSFHLQWSGHPQLRQKQLNPTNAIIWFRLLGLKHCSTLPEITRLVTSPTTMAATPQVLSPLLHHPQLITTTTS